MRFKVKLLIDRMCDSGSRAAETIKARPERNWQRSHPADCVVCKAAALTETTPSAWNEDSASALVSAALGYVAHRVEYGDDVVALAALGAINVFRARINRAAARQDMGEIGRACDEIREVAEQPLRWLPPDVREALKEEMQ